MKKLFVVLLLCLLCASCFSQFVWTQKTSLPAAGRESAGYFTIGNSIYVVCGRTSISPYAHTAQLWEYNTVTDTWQQRANYPGGARTAPVAFAAGGKGYVVSGGYPTMYSDCWAYDPSTDSWAQKSSFPGGGRYTAAHFVLGNDMYMVGGYFNGSQTNEVWRYNVVLDTWQKMNNFPGGATQASTGFAVGGNGYIVTRFANWVASNNAWKYNAANDTWSAIATLPGSPRITAVSFVLNGIAYVGLGSDGQLQSHYNDFYAYNPALNSWSAAPTFPSPGRRHAIALTVGQKAYVGMGVSAPPPGGPTDFRSDLYSFGEPCTAPVAPDVNATQLSLCTGSAFTVSAMGQGTLNWYTSPTATGAVASGSTYTSPPLGAGIYTIYVQAQTCTVSTMNWVVVTVHPLPQIVVNSSSQPVCSGQSAILTASGAVSYSWSTGNSGMSIVVWPSAPTVYSVTGTDKNNCSGSSVFSQSVAALPQLLVSASNDVVCPGQSATLTAAGAAFYNWSTGTMGASIVVTPSANTVYTVTGTDLNNCSSSATVTQYVADCTGITPNVSSEIGVFPNPVTGELKITGLKAGDGNTIEIWDGSGRKVFQDKLTSGRESLSVPEMDTGVYFYIIRKDSRVLKQGKLVKH